MKAPSSTKLTFWQAHILKARQHPGGIQSYLDIHNLPQSSFYKWQKKLSDQSFNLSSEKKDTKKTNPFLPVVLSSQDQHENHTSNKHLPDPKWVALVLANFVKELS